MFRRISLVLLSLDLCGAFQTGHPSKVAVAAAAAREPSRLFAAKEKNSFLQGVANLWDEVIEVSTYGPSERKLLKARREAKARAAADDGAGDDNDDSMSLESFRRAQRSQSPMAASPETDTDFDGYAMRDMLLEKWGASLDVDFQRQPGAVYCTILPVAFGSRKCRHETELEYLMHLQGIIEVLHKYGNLDLFINFVITTSKVPKVGTDAVPFRLELANEDLETIL